jgi:hypothetical protein
MNLYLLVGVSICAGRGVGPVGVTRPLLTAGRTYASVERAPGALRLRGGELIVTPQEAQEAYQTDLAAEAAEGEFLAAVKSLKSEPGAVQAAFGGQAADLVSNALQSFDTAVEGAGLRGSAAATGSRAALLERVNRALREPVRQQLTALTKQAFTQFRREIAGLKPSADIDVKLKSLLADAKAAYDTGAKDLLPAGGRFSYEYERRQLVAAMEEAATEFLQGLQVQGMFLQKSGRIPVDVGMHWLLMNPFGADGRYSAVGPSEPAYKGPKMKLKSAEESKERTKPKKGAKKGGGQDMVFTDKMLQ